MGKRKRVSNIKTRGGLEADIESEKYAQPKNRNKVRKRCDEDLDYVEAGLTRKILKAAHRQLHEDVEEDEKDDAWPTLSRANTMKLKTDASSDSEDEDNDHTSMKFDDGDSNAFFEDFTMGEEDELVLEQFVNKHPEKKYNLSDYISETLAGSHAMTGETDTELGAIQVDDIPENVRDVYKQIGETLKVYRSGKLPKLFKFIPKCAHWIQLLDLTDPMSWSSAALYEATRIFASNLDDKEVATFYKYVLMPRVRDEIGEHKRLNPHLYQAVMKSLYKPFGFMRGFLLPLCESGTCSLREAIIIGSILARISIPPKCVWYVLYALAEMPYTGGTSIFMRVLIDKKHALPQQVINFLASHFLLFMKDERNLPVLWHQALLSFVQRHKNNIALEHRKQLNDLTKKHHHAKISPEIQRELNSIKGEAMVVE